MVNHAQNSTPTSHRRCRANEIRKTIVQTNGVRIGLLNIRGGRNPDKWRELYRLITHLNIDIFCVTETHLREEEKPEPLHGFNWTGRNRHEGERKGGGIGILTSVKLDTVETTYLSPDRSTEHLWKEIRIGSHLVYIAVIYMSPSDQTWNDRIYGTLEVEISRLVRTNELFIITGDFNAHLEELGDRPNAGSPSFMTFIERNNLYVLNLSSKCNGKYTWGNVKLRTCIDYMLSNFELSNYLKEMWIDEEGVYSLNTDHNLVLAELTIGKPPRRSRQARPKRKNPYDLQDERNLINYSDNLDELLPTNPDYPSLIKAIRNAADINLTRRNIDIIKDWWDADVEEAIKIRRNYCRRHRHAVHLRLSGEIISRFWEDYKEAKMRAARMVKEKLSSFNRKIAASILAGGGGAGKKFWRFIKRCTAGDTRPEQFSMLLRNGKISNDPTLIKSNIHYHFMGKFSQPGPTVDIPFIHQEAPHPLSAEITGGEILRATKRLSAGTAAGLDLIPPELLKNLKLGTLEKVRKVFNDILDSGNVPQDWKHSYVRLVHKGGGKPKEDIENYRPVTITATLYKVFMHIIKARIEAYIESTGILGEGQNGFRKNRRLEDNLYVLFQAIEIAYREKRTLFVAFLDLKSAFDTVNRNLMWKKLHELGVPDSILRLLMNIYEGESRTIALADLETEPITCNVGVRQGCPLSPLLFITFLGQIEAELTATGAGIKFPDYTSNEGRDLCTIPALLCADDIACMAYKADDMQKLLDAAEKFINNNRLQLSRDKSKMMIFNNAREPHTNFRLGPENIITTENYRYLGINICSGGPKYLSLHEKDILTKACRHKGAIKHSSLHSYNKYETTRIAWKAACVPALTFGNAVTTYTGPTRKALERIQMEVCRHAVGSSRLTANEAVQGEVGISTFETREAQAKITYLLRLEKMNNTHYAKKIFIYTDATRTNWRKRVEVLQAKYTGNTITRKNSHTIKFNSVRSMIRESAHQIWRQAMVNKSTLNLYRRKEKYLWEPFYDGSPRSTLLFKARTGSLETRKRLGRFTDIDETCSLCNLEIEDIHHIILRCPKLRRVERFHSEPQDNEDDSLAFRLGIPEFIKGVVESTMDTLYDWFKKNKYPTTPTA